MPDFIVENHGSILLLAPFTEEARYWIDMNIDEDAQRFGRSVVVEPRYIEPILQGIENDGLEVIL